MVQIASFVAQQKSRTMSLRELLMDCAGSTASEERERVRQAMAELGGSGLDGRGILDACALDGMLRTGSALDAVLALIGTDAHFIVSRGENGMCLATVVHPGSSDEALAEAPTLALALLSAHISAVLSWVESGSSLMGCTHSPITTTLH